MTTSTRHPHGHAQPIRGPRELVQAIPYLIGYHPAESLVLVGLNDGRLVVTARLDLTDLDADGGAPGGLLDHTIRCATDSEATEFVAIVYSDDADPPAAIRVRQWPASGRAQPLAGAAFIGAVGVALARLDAALLDSLLVRSGRCWSYSRAHPAGGWDLDAAPSPFVAEATVAGAAPRCDRGSVAASLDPCPAAERAAFKHPIAEAENASMSAVRNGGRLRHERAARRMVLAAAEACDVPGWAPPADSELARLAVALTTIETRDEVWLAIDNGRLDGRPLMLELARRCPSPYDAAPLFLYGWACWRAGNSMLAGVAARRALAADSTCTAAQLLIDAVEHGVDPHRVPLLRRPRTHR